jgi:hypothetical protein
MRTIFKYPLYIADYVSIEMPRGAEILHVAVQGNQPCIWALVDAEADLEVREFNCYGTGHPVSSVPAKHIGSLILHGGALVFHVFEKPGEH